MNDINNKPGRLCFEVQLTSVKGTPMSELCFEVKFFVYGHPKAVLFTRETLTNVEGRYYALMDERTFVDGNLFCEAYVKDVVMRVNTGYVIGGHCACGQATTDTSGGYTLSVNRVEKPSSSTTAEIIAEELHGEKMHLPELLADRAVADEAGNRITDTYVTRHGLTNHIKETYNKQFLENPPLITDGYITPAMLSEDTKNLLEATGTEVTNLPDGEDLESVHGVLKLANKEYNPNSYDGLGRQYVRRNVVNGVNTLVQSMMKWSNTLYIIRYDHDLQGRTVTIPEGCTLMFESGKFYNGKVVLNDTQVRPYGCLLKDYIDCEIEGTFRKGQVLYSEEYKQTVVWTGEKWKCSYSVLFRVYENKLQQSVDDGETWEDVSDYIASYFRFVASPNQNSVGKIQISQDNKTWTDLSPEITNYMRIADYVATTAELPKNAPQGLIYGVGPVDGSTYTLYVSTSNGWINNGSFASFTAGVVQETGDNENAVMSQKAVTEKFDEQEVKLAELGSEVSDTRNVLGINQSNIAVSVGVANFAIKDNGDAEVTSNFSISNIIHLKSGDVIQVIASAYSNVAVVSIVEEGVYIPVVIGKEDRIDISQSSYRYRAEKDIDVVICSYVNKFPNSAIVIASKVVNNNVERISNIEKSQEILQLSFPSKLEPVFYNGVFRLNMTIEPNSAFIYSHPIKMDAGDMLKLKGTSKGDNAFDAPVVLAKVTEAGVLLSAEILNQTASILSYTANNDCYVSFCVRSSAYLGAELLVSGVSRNVGKLDVQIKELSSVFQAPINANTQGYYASYAEIGAKPSMSFVYDTGWYNAKVEVKKGERYHITGQGGGTPLLWVNIDDNNILRLKSEQNANVFDYTITMVTDGYLVCNFKAEAIYSLYKESTSGERFPSVDYFSRLPMLTDNPISSIRSWGLTGIVRSWGFIGDSLMSGFMDNTNRSQYEYSWGQRMCSILGTEGYNFSAGGMTTKAWIYNRDNVPFDNERIWLGAKTNLKQAYIIGLGVNDRAELVTGADGNYPIGDITTDLGSYNLLTDTDTNAATFVGYYAGVIQRIKAVQPNSKIFLVTIPATGNYISEYNKAIRDIATRYAASYVYLIDIEKHAPDFENRHFKKMYFNTGHLNVLGYEYVAYLMIQYIDHIIRNNYADFADINTL